MNPKNIFVWLVIFSLSLLLSACLGDDVEPADQATSTDSPAVAATKHETDEGPAEIWADYAAFIEETMAENNIPGVAAAVVQGNEIVFVRGFGRRDVANDLPVTPETLFHIGSTHKSLTAMLIASLVDDGLFDWDTPVVEIYPDFELSDASATEVVTLRHLLSMRSGIPDEAEDDFDVENAGPEDIFDYLPEVTLLAAPGEAFSYSNLSAATAGYLGVLAVAADPDDLYDGYAALLKERVLDPIGMETAVVRVSEARANPNYGHSYIVGDDGQPVAAEPEDVDGDVLAPAGSLKASAIDMARYISTQLNQGLAPNGTRVVSAENLTETWQPYLESYGMGWESTTYQGVTLIAHEGSFDNYLSIIGFVPELNLGFVILTNSEETAVGLIETAPRYLIDLVAKAE